MASSSSSSSSSYYSCFNDVPETKYDVFISFRGEDIRSSFLSHLVKALRHQQIDVYVDEVSLQPGDEISSTLLQAIQEASISLVIFSERYASSKWCMEELVKMIQCMEQDQRIVIPVFYKVDPCDARHQKGSFGEALDKHQQQFKGNMVKVNGWRSALKKAANLSGFHYPSKYKNESELIEEIVKDVLKKLSHIFSIQTEGLVGIDKHLECIESLLAIESREVRIIGIWGMGGIGKTTIAEAVFDKYSSQYEGCCFLKNVGEESQKHGLPQKDRLFYLFGALISELLQEDVHLKGSSKAQFTNVMRRLSRKRVFIVLDDLNASEQLEHLTGENICLGPFSRVIVTTRDKQILRKVHGIYEVQKLNSENSLQLFCLNAFNKIYPEIGYEKLSKMAVDYASGIPLALKILGSCLYSRSIEVWESELRKLKIYPHMKIYNVLKLSYDGLDDLEKNIFLDISFFFKGQDKDDVIKLLGSYGFFATIGIDNLLRKALIIISKYNTIEMHDLIEQMGWEIVRQENKDPGKRSRLRNPEDVYDVLKNNKGTDLVEGIVFATSQTRDLYLHADTFKRMPKLRFLKFYTLLGQGPSNVYIPTELESFSDELRYLEWSNYPLKSLPSTFCAEMLVELRMPRSQVSKLWDGMQNLVNLKAINLNACKMLVELPDFTKASNLKRINLAFCESLCRVHPSILSIHTLKVLDLRYCKELKNLKGDIHLKSLEVLMVYGCSSLLEFSVSSDKLSWLNFNQTGIDMLHSSIGRLNKLETFILSDLRLKGLPNELCFLTSLVELRLPGCEQLVELPHNMKALSRLNILDLRNCRGLRSLPELPSSIMRLDATNCTSLATVFSIKWLSSSNEIDFSFENCTRLDEHSLYDLMEVAHLTVLPAAFRHLLVKRSRLYNHWVVPEFNSSKVCYPGIEVPEWFRYRARQASITVELDQPDQLLGIFLYCVISQVPSDKRVSYIACQCYLRDGNRIIYEHRWNYINVDYGLNSNHVCIWYDPYLRGRRLEDHLPTYGQKISFQFVFRSSKYQNYVEEVGPLKKKQKMERNSKLVIAPDPNWLVQECGICPIYVSDIPQKYEDKY